MATVINDIQPGLSPNPNGSPATVGTTLTGPVFAGTVFNRNAMTTMNDNCAGLINHTLAAIPPIVVPIVPPPIVMAPPVITTPLPPF